MCAGYVLKMTPHAAMCKHTRLSYVLSGLASGAFFKEPWSGINTVPSFAYKPMLCKFKHREVKVTLPQQMEIENYSCMVKVK